MKAKSVILKACIFILSLLMIFTLPGCDNKSNETDQVTKYSVAGTVLDGEGTPVANVSLAIQGSKIKSSSVEVNEKGEWSAGDLQGEVTITPAKDNWIFEPPVVTVTEEDAGKKDTNFTGQEIIFPGAKTLTPDVDSTGVEPGATVTVEFNQDVTEVDLNGIIIEDSDCNPVSGVTASLSDRTITIAHDDFEYNRTYTVTVPAGAVTNTDGTDNKEISWSFTIRDILPAPAYVSLVPGENATNVSPGTAVTVKFNQNIEAVDLSGIAIKGSDSNPVNGVTASLSDRTITIAHDDFDYNGTYTVTVPAGAVTNIDGIDNEEISWGFTIRDDLPAPDYVSLVPGENATDVDPGAAVTVEFNREVTEVDLDGITIEDSDNNQVSGVAAGLSGRTIIIYNHDDLEYNKTYTVTVPAGAVTDTYGIGNNEISWSFTTVAYKFVESWGDFRYPEGIATDSSGNIYVADTQYNRIQKFDSSGNYLSQWGSRGSGNGEFKQPKGITADSFGNIYVADTWNNRIQKFDSSGNYLSQWGSNGFGNSQFRYPEGIAIDVSGNIYVADTQNNRIQKFDSSGNYLSQWGSNGVGDGEFRIPMGIAVDSSGNIYVTDTHNHRIQKFDSSGNYLFQWGRDGYGDGEFTYPAGITVDNFDNIYVVDSNNHRIQKFDSKGNYLAQWGSHGDGDSEFYEPKGITVDSSGDTYVADTYNHRIQKFAPVE